MIPYFKIEIFAKRPLRMTLGLEGLNKRYLLERSFGAQTMAAANE